MSALKILVIPGSLRTGSLNARLAAVAAHELAQQGAEITRISLADFPLPIYDGDLQSKSGVPKHAARCFANAPLRLRPPPKAGSAARARWRRCG
jgi:NAD(P)H-dependent FMN reductase